MKRVSILVVLTLTALAPVTASSMQSEARAGIDWPAFRGAGASGIAEGFATPDRWDVGSAADVAWSTAIPGLGHSSPVVWGDRIFLTTAISGADNSLKPGLYGDIAPVVDDSEHVWKVYCLDKRSGEIRWEHTVRTGVPAVKRHTKGTHANPTVATDGTRVVALFGSEGLYAFDLEGTLLWERELGVLDAGFFMVPEAQWGYASSPTLFEDTVIVQADVQQGSFLAAFALQDGSEVWRTERHDVPTFGTPTVYPAPGGPALAVNGFRHIGGYDARTGEELWRLTGGGDIPTPTPVLAHGLLFITNAHGPAAPIYAIRTSAAGDITPADGTTSNEHIAWSQSREGAYMSTPLVYGSELYIVRHNGVLVVFDARTGHQHYQERLGGGGAFTASPVAADGKVYIPSEDGDVYVVKAGPTFDLLATNAFGEPLLATPAISEGLMLFRTASRVLAIGLEPAP